MKFNFFFFFFFLHSVELKDCNTLQHLRYKIEKDVFFRRILSTSECKTLDIPCRVVYVQFLTFVK